MKETSEEKYSSYLIIGSFMTTSLPSKFMILARFPGNIHEISRIILRFLWPKFFLPSLNSELKSWDMEQRVNWN